MDTNTETLDIGNLPARAKLILEAAFKMERGRKMFEEGKLEFLHLTDTKPKNGNSHKAKVPGLSKVKPAKKVAKKVSTFRPEDRTDKEIGKEVLKLINATGSATMTFLEKRMKLGGRRLVRVISLLLQSDDIEWAGQGVRGNPKYLRISAKKVNGHSGGGTPARAHASPSKRKGIPLIDVTDEKIMEKAKKFLATHDWVSKPKLLKAIDLGNRPGERWIDLAKKEGIIKEVHKRNNPAHKSEPRSYGNEFTYYELTQ